MLIESELIETRQFDTDLFRTALFRTALFRTVLFRTVLFGTGLIRTCWVGICWSGICWIRSCWIRSCWIRIGAFPAADDPLQGYPNRPVGRLHRVELRDAVIRAPGTQGLPEAFRLAVIHLPARPAQLVHEVAQGAPEQHQPLAVQRHPLQRATAFDQQDAAVAPGLGRAHPDLQITQGRLGERELILEDQDADAHRSGTSRLPSGTQSSSNPARACGAGEGSGLFRLTLSAQSTTPTGLYPPAGPA